MEVRTIEFIGSFEKVEQCPVGDLPEYAFIGRSNVGKSSLINALTNRKSIARVSSTPGKTQNINYYLINDAWYLVDLPGYGYAKASKKDRAKYQKMINSFLLKRHNIYCVFCLIDSRHDLQKIDTEFLDWLGENQLAFQIIFTKIDKLKQSNKKTAINKILKQLSEFWDPLPKYFISSAEAKIGLSEILINIDQINQAY